MKDSHAQAKRTRIRILITACTTIALAVVFAVSLPRTIQADRVTPPPMPSNIQVPEGNKVFFEGHAVGWQEYICLPAGLGFSWTFYGPQATLFDDHGKQVVTHFLSPNPVEGGTLRATWQHSRDTSTVWAMAIESSSDPAFVAPGAIPWLLLSVVGAQDQPHGSHVLTDTTFIQRLNTSGGSMPSTGCTSSTDVGRREFVPYTADYLFYKGG